MNSILLVLISAIIALIVGLAAGYVLRKFIAKSRQDSIEAKTEALVETAKAKQKEILLETKTQALEIKENAEKDQREGRAKLLDFQSKLSQREGILNQKLDSISQKEEQLEKGNRTIQRKTQELGEIRKKQMATLEKVASLSREKAKEVLLEMVEKDQQERVLGIIKKAENRAKDEADTKAKNIISQAIERYARPQASESTATTVSLPSDEMKGRIIGREGRNIKRIEELCGIEIVVDDTPEAIVISGFNPIRRHVAKRTLERLIQDGRIHPAKIEETVNMVKKEIAHEIKEAGEQAAYELGIADLDSKLVQVLGRLRFRSSYGQNVLRHSIEVANFAKIMAEELGADVNIAKKAGLLHDIGKAVDHEIEGTHIEIGRNILKKFGVSEEIIHAVECHHEDVEPHTVEAVIVKAADGISGARPGARKDTYENYIKRLTDLENIALSFEGAEKAYAIQAGREVRIFVTPEEVDDLGAKKLAQAIADKIEKELRYPGEIKVNVIRETRAVDFAR
ncbi:MAG: ribonuclease Y [Patescibacteria group bacterium]